jgi:hypothetical protein
MSEPRGRAPDGAKQVDRSNDGRSPLVVAFAGQFAIAALDAIAYVRDARELT